MAKHGSAATDAARVGRIEAACYVTLDVASERYSIAVPTLEEWVRKGRLRAYRPGRRILIRPDELDRFIAAHPVGGGA